MILAAGLFLLAAELLTGIAIALLSFDRIRSWFARVSADLDLDADHIAVSVQEKIRTGQHRVVYGIFNKRTSTFVDGESVIADRIDEELASIHQGMPLVIYN